MALHKKWAVGIIHMLAIHHERKGTILSYVSAQVWNMGQVETKVIW